MINIQDYQKKGYQIVRNLFSKEEIDTVYQDSKAIFINQLNKVGFGLDFETEEDFNKALFQLFEKYPERIISTGKHIQHSVSLHRLSLDQRIISILQQLGLAFPNVCTRPMLFFNAQKLAKKQVYWKMDPHQDWRSMQGSLNSIVAWVALVDIDLSLGALEILPGSHLNGLQTGEMVDSFGIIPDTVLEGKSWLPIEVKKGDVLFFSSFLIHQSGNNSTENGIRWSCHFRYNDMNEPDFIERGYPHPYIYYPDATIITPNYPPVEKVKKYFS